MKPYLLHPARDRANNRRGGAPRGEHPASWDARRPRQRVYARVRRAMRLRATITGPPTGAAAPERLSALRFPLCWKREPCKPRRANASRER